MTQAQIATAFSNGNFELAYPYLADEVVWRVVGEDVFRGKDEVINNCKQVAGYFKSVTTNFITTDLIVDGTRVAVTGTAEFIRDGNTVNFVHACDVYQFNESNQLEAITSYCIAEKK